MQFGIALSGGYIKGMAHIGVLKFIEERGLKVDIISGTSAGSLVGVLYAAGYSASEIETIACSINWRDIIKHIVRTKFPRYGLVNINFLKLILERYLEHFPDFGSLKIPFVVAAVDIVRGKPVFMTAGDLKSAVLASCAVPGIFTPVERENLFLVDGGVLHNLPTVPLVEAGVKNIAAAVVNGSSIPDQKPKNIFDILFRSFSVAAKEREGSHLQLADFQIIIDSGDIGMWDLARTTELINLGYEAARTVLQDASFKDKRKTVSWLNIFKGK